MDGYDEDVTENAFYKAFLSKSKSLYNTATENRWMICIPRKGTTTRSHYVSPQFETHILKPIEGGESNNYQTYNEKEVRISGSIITTTKGFGDVKTVRILFEETFFNAKKESYHILCIEQPLEGGAFSGTAEPVTPNLETLQNCIDFLWAGTGNKRSRKKIDEVISIFNSTYQRLETESIRHAMDAASAVFTRAMQTALKEPHLRRPALGSKAFMDNVKVAIETYVTHGLHKRIFKGLCSFLANQDAELNKITRNLADLQVKDLGVKQQLCKNIPRAKKVLSNLNKFSTPLEKLYVLKLTVMSVSEVKDPSDAITADDLLPVLVFLVVKSEIPNWLANLTYMYNFHFSKSKNDEFQFYLSSVEAATEYVRSKKLNHLVGLSHIQRQNSLGRLFQRCDSTERPQGPSPVELLFGEIKNGNIENALQMLSIGKKASKPLNEQLCHPLCSCDSCERLMASKRNDPMAVTVFSRDDVGSTVLHSAAEFDQDNILYQLIKLGAAVNATNYHGSTPLHLACLRGHKKAAMMLIHYGANLNAADNDNNLPLHLAAANGHEKVVEALVLSDSHHGQKLDVNAANENGDTSLHIAARWGFANLVTILLDSGASIEARNNKKETPVNCSANLKVQELLINASKEVTTEQQKNYLYASPDEQQLNDEMTSFPGESDFSPSVTGASLRVIRIQKELHTLMKVISDGDVEMVKLKLGITQENEDIDFVHGSSPDDGLCHPLCQCAKCSGKEKNAISEPLNQTVNMANEDGVTCLHIAALYGYERIVHLLLKRAGAFTNCRTKDNQKTPLHFSCQYNHVACVSMLLKHGARVDIKDASGNTPLHFCCTNGHISPAILLLQSGANANVPNKRGNTPLHESARWNCPDLISLLLHYGASTKSRNKDKLTPLQYAQQDDVIEILQKAEKELDGENPDFIRVRQQQLDSYSTIEKSHKSPKVGPFQPIPENDAVQQLNIRRTHSMSESLPGDSDTRRRSWSPEVEAIRGGPTVSRVPLKRNSSVAALFQAFEEDDIEKLRSLAAGVQTFDRKRRLRRVSTIDKSEPFFDHHLVHMLSIQHFDNSLLRHATTRDRINSIFASDDVFPHEEACEETEELAVKKESGISLREKGDVEGTELVCLDFGPMNSGDGDEDRLVDKEQPVSNLSFDSDRKDVDLGNAKKEFEKGQACNAEQMDRPIIGSSEHVGHAEENFIDKQGMTEEDDEKSLLDKVSLIDEESLISALDRTTRKGKGIEDVSTDSEVLEGNESTSSEDTQMRVSTVNDIDSGFVSSKKCVDEETRLEHIESDVVLDNEDTIMSLGCKEGEPTILAGKKDGKTDSLIEKSNQESCRNDTLLNAETSCSITKITSDELVYFDTQTSHLSKGQTEATPLKTGLEVDRGFSLTDLDSSLLPKRQELKGQNVFESAASGFIDSPGDRNPGCFSNSQTDKLLHIKSSDTLDYGHSTENSRACLTDESINQKHTENHKEQESSSINSEIPSSSRNTENNHRFDDREKVLIVPLNHDIYADGNIASTQFKDLGSENEVCTNDLSTVNGYADVTELTGSDASVPQDIYAGKEDNYV